MSTSPTNEIIVNNPKNCDSLEHQVLSNRISDGVEKIIATNLTAANSITKDVGDTGRSLGLLVDGVGKDVIKTGCDVMHRVGDSSEKNLVATLNTGTDIIKDSGDATRHLGALVNGVDKDVLQTGCAVSDRVSNIGERNVISTLQTGKEILKDASDSSRHLGSMINGVDKDVLQTGCAVSDRVSNIGERNMVSTLQTGKEILKDMNDTNRHLGGLIDGTNKEVIKTGCDINGNISETGRDVTRDIQSAKLTTHKIGHNLKDSIHDLNDGMLISSKNTDHLIDDTKDSIRKEINRNRYDNLKDLNVIEREVLKNRCAIKGKVVSSSNSIEKEVLKSRASIKLQMSENKESLKNQALKNKCALERQILEGNCGIKLQASENKCALQLQISETKCLLERQASDNRAALELDACKNREYLSKQMADYHGEIKGRIDKRYNSTVALIKDTENARLRDKLLAQEQENLYLRIRLGGEVGAGVGVARI